MADQKKSHGASAASQAEQGTKKGGARHGGISALVEQLHSASSLHLLAGFFQLFLGVAVVLISILGLIRPFWLSTVFTVIASISALAGLYFCYTTIAAIKSNDLLREAMRRIVEDQN